MSKLKIRNGNTWEEIPTGGVGVPSGGTQGQALLKTGPNDHQTGWGNVATSVNGQTGDVTVREPGTWVELTKTYTQNAYVSEAAFNRCYARTNGEIVVFYFNLSVDSSPGSTFRAIGKINLPESLLDSFSLTVASQSGGATLLMLVSSDGSISIYNAYGTASGFYRTTAVFHLASALE